MPCSDGREPWSYPPVDTGTQKRLDAATRAACNLATGFAEYFYDYPPTVFEWESEVDSLRRIEREGYITSETVEWFENHKKEDEARLERLKASALAKLTPDEREALGIK